MFSPPRPSVAVVARVVEFQTPCDVREAATVQPLAGTQSGRRGTPPARGTQLEGAPRTDAPPVVETKTNPNQATPSEEGPFQPRRSGWLAETARLPAPPLSSPAQEEAKPRSIDRGFVLAATAPHERAALEHRPPVRIVGLPPREGPMLCARFYARRSEEATGLEAV